MGVMVCIALLALLSSLGAEMARRCKKSGDCDAWSPRPGQPYPDPVQNGPSLPGATPPMQGSTPMLPGEQASPVFRWPALSVTAALSLGDPRRAVQPMAFLSVIDQSRHSLPNHLDNVPQKVQTQIMVGD